MWQTSTVTQITGRCAQIDGTFICLVDFHGRLSLLFSQRSQIGFAVEQRNLGSVRNPSSLLPP